MKSTHIMIGASIGFALAWLVKADDNAEPRYAANGLPDNCRAVVASNLEGWREGRWTMEGALNSIDRNCGRFGLSWTRGTWR